MLFLYNTSFMELETWVTRITFQRQKAAKERFFLVVFDGKQVFANDGVLDTGGIDQVNIAISADSPYNKSLFVTASGAAQVYKYNIGVCPPLYKSHSILCCPGRLIGLSPFARI